MLTLAAVGGCAASKVACQVIRVANNACTMIEFSLPDGGVDQVAVSRDELEGLARTASARRDRAVVNPK